MLRQTNECILKYCVSNKEWRGKKVSIQLGLFIHLAPARRQHRARVER
jgi:hypothetical protein